MSDPSDNDWQEVWEARVSSLGAVLGPADGTVFHSPDPFTFGGNADVLSFSHHLPGVVYVTAELTGKPQASYADYELMICHRSPLDWGPHIISRLAAYTQQAYIDAGETMDIDSATPPHSQIKAFLFVTYATFALFNRQFDLRLCLGITKAELNYKLDHGAEKLLELLKRYNVYPYTDLGRVGVPLAVE